MKRRLALQWLLGGALTPAMVRAQGASGYPDRPVNLVIPFPPGGLADSVARMLIPSLEAALGKTVIAVNKAGAAGALGTASVVNARPDGYNLLFTLSSISTLPEQAHVNHQKPPFLLNQLTPIARITTDPMAVVTYEDSRYKDLTQLINDARARPGMVSYGSSGIYGAVHVPAEMFAQSAGISLNHIPYTGGAPLIQALLGRQVDMTVLPRSSILPYLHAGKVRALAVLGNQRWTQLPDVPSMQDLGLDVSYVPWTGLLAQADLPQAIVNRLRMAVATAVADPAFKAMVEKSGGTLAYMDAGEFQKYWSGDITRLNDVIKRIGKSD